VQGGSESRVDVDGELKARAIHEKQSGSIIGEAPKPEVAVRWPLRSSVGGRRAWRRLGGHPRGDGRGQFLGRHLSLVPS